MSRLAHAVLCTALACAALLGAASPAHAGGGPETVLVVVNADSPASLQVANRYASLRDIPATHLLYLHDVPTDPVVKIDVFRDKILKPIEAYLQAQGLADAVETIAYSVGFPYGVNFDDEARAKEFRVRSPLSKTASITGMTYFYRHVLAENPAGYLDLQGNGYFRRLAGMTQQRRASPPLAQRRLEAEAQGAMRSKDWRRAAEALTKLVALVPENSGHWYNLTCCLALLGRNDEAITALEKAVEAGFDGADHAAKDPDLESLRELPAFQKLLEVMRAGGEAADPDGAQKTRGFSARVAWLGAEDAAKDAPDDDAHRYRMAVMLGWAGAHGMSVQEILANLDRTATSDDTHPDGTVYLMVNKDKNRIGPRQPMYPGVLAALKRLGRRVQVLEQGQDGQDGKVPRGKSDAIGVLAGIASFSWNDDDGLLLPGAIAEHLTSFGAHFGTPGQTKCVEFLRHGAAGTCGTVAEPYNTPLKFPLPWMHVHYARGCSMAEAFYQSIWGPYQQLVLGDPLARPFARFAEVSLASPDAAAPWVGTVDVLAGVEAARGLATQTVELWVDGTPRGSAAPGTAIPLDTTTLADGEHELRLVAVDASPIQTRSYVKQTIHVANGERSITVKETPEPVAWGEPVEISGRAEGVTEVSLLRGADVLATAPVKGTRFDLSLASARLGEGVTRVRIVGTGPAGAARSPLLAVEVTPPTGQHMPLVVNDADVLPGLRATLTDGDGEEHEGVVITLATGRGRTLAHDLAVLGVAKPTRLRVDGLLRAPVSGLWQLEVHVRTAVRMTLAGEEVLAFDEAPPGGRAYVRLGLAEGWHALTIETSGAGAERLSLLLSGPQPVQAVSDRLLGWIPEERARAEPPEAFVAIARGNPASLSDGRVGGGGVTVGAEGLEIHWAKTERNVANVVLYPARGGQQPRLPEEWIVEKRTSTKGRWRAVKHLEVVLCPGHEAPRKDRDPPAPRYVALAFDKTSARQVRVRPADAGADVPTITEVIVLVRERSRR